ncbi:MAG: D-alanine--D-alanine ligase [Patescibacteria group bacterium]|jgi:D-alanine-D-alanine ligase
MIKRQILTIFGGSSDEHSVSLASGRMVTRFLDKSKYQVSTCIISKKGLWSFNGHKSLGLANALQHMLKTKYKIAFIALHGPFGEDGKIQSILESLGLPYTGSNASVSAIAMDKDLSNKIVQFSKFSVPSYKVFSDKQIRWNFFPCIVKPVSQGSSYGVNIVKRKADLKKAINSAFRYDSRIMIQKFIRGREITCSVLEKSGKPFALPPTEIIPKSSSFFDFKAKYCVGGSAEITPANLTLKQTHEVKKLALKAHVIFGCRGMSRSDFILNGKIFYYLETNTIPGLTKTSLLPQQAKAAGISFSEMLDLIIDSVKT